LRRAPGCDGVQFGKAAVEQHLAAVLIDMDDALERDPVRVDRGGIDAVPGPGKIDRRTVHDADRPMGIVWLCRSGVKGRGNWVGFLVAGHDRFPCVSEGTARGGELLPSCRGWL
jgi:hypothetical protein